MFLGKSSSTTQFVPAINHLDDIPKNETEKLGQKNETEKLELIESKFFFKTRLAERSKAFDLSSNLFVGSNPTSSKLIFCSYLVQILYLVN